MSNPNNFQLNNDLLAHPERWVAAQEQQAQPQYQQQQHLRRVYPTATAGTHTLPANLASEASQRNRKQRNRDQDQDQILHLFRYQDQPAMAKYAPLLTNPPLSAHPIHILADTSAHPNDIGNPPPSFRYSGPRAQGQPPPFTSRLPIPPSQNHINPFQQPLPRPERIVSKEELELQEIAKAARSHMDRQARGEIIPEAEMRVVAQDMRERYDRHHQRAPQAPTLKPTRRVKHTKHEAAECAAALGPDLSEDQDVKSSNPRVAVDKAGRVLAASKAYRGALMDPALDINQERNHSMKKTTNDIAGTWTLDPATSQLTYRESDAWNRWRGQEPWERDEKHELAEVYMGVCGTNRNTGGRRKAAMANVKTERKSEEPFATGDEVDVLTFLMSELETANSPTAAPEPGPCNDTVRRCPPSVKMKAALDAEGLSVTHGTDDDLSSASASYSDFDTVIDAEDDWVLVPPRPAVLPPTIDCSADGEDADVGIAEVEIEANATAKNGKGKWIGKGDGSRWWWQSNTT